MSYIVLDFETYYDTKKGSGGERPYSLRHMTPPEYIMDERFECIGCAIVEGDTGLPSWLHGQDLVDYLAGLGARQRAGEPIVVLSHNALFDMCLLYWRFGLLPNLMIDTMGMSRAMVFAFTGAVSLQAVGEHLQLPLQKTKMPNVAGMRAADIRAAGLWDEYVAYALRDAVVCREIFKRLRVEFPREEYAIMDMVLRMAVEPMFEVDADILVQHAATIRVQKETLLQRCGIDKSDLMSNDKFADVLRSLGVEPPMKVSPTTGKQTYAFAKSDPAMIDLSEDERPDVQAIVAARVGHKSTLEESRTDTLLRISQITWGGNRQQLMPIPLRYSGAHTHRLSGDWKINAQNWTKAYIEPDGTKSVGKLRLAHKAPHGHKVVKCDASQIEARFVSALAGQDDLTEDFRNGVDIYSNFAEENIYHYPVSRKTEDERFVGKNAILGLGFGVGPPKFRKETAAKSFVNLGRSIVLDPIFTEGIVKAYRTRFPKIPQAWNFWRDILPQMSRENPNVAWGPVVVEKQRIRLPNGLHLFYNGLHYDTSAGNFGGEWKCKFGKKTKRVYGAMIFENVVQALARIATMQAALRVQRIMKLRHQIHDDLIYIVPDDMVFEFQGLLAEEMSKPLAWFPSVPLAAEAASGQSYGECK